MLTPYRVSALGFAQGRFDKITRRNPKADKALVGADSILADGTLINGRPTSNLAKAASDKKIPFYCVCETNKFDIQNHRSKHDELEPGFEMIPSTSITGIITEQGLMNPDQVIDFIAEADKSPL